MVLPQFLVTAFSSIIFTLFAPHHSVISPVIDKVAAVVTTNTDSTILDSIGDLIKRAVTESSDWDALGIIFR